MRIENSNNSIRTREMIKLNRSRAPSIGSKVIINIGTLHQTNNHASSSTAAIRIFSETIEGSRNNYHSVKINDVYLDGSLPQYSIAFFEPGINTQLIYRGDHFVDVTPSVFTFTDPELTSSGFPGIIFRSQTKENKNSNIRLELNKYDGNKNLGFAFNTTGASVFDSCIIYIKIDDYSTGLNPLVQLANLDLRNYSKLIFEFSEGYCDNYAIALPNIIKDATSEIIIRNSTLRANKAGVAVIYSNSDIILDNVTLINDGVTAPISSATGINVIVKDVYANSLTVDPNVTELVELITRDTNVQ